MNGPEGSRPPVDTNMGEHETSSVREPRIYVASLADYNDGRLHGRWIDANAIPEDMERQIGEMLEASPMLTPAEEWAIHDYDGFGPICLSEYESLETVSRLAEGIVDHGDSFAAWVAQRDSHSDAQVEEYEDAYWGEYDSAEAFGESILDDMGVDLDNLTEINPSLRPYVTIDVEGWVRDMVLGGEVSIVENTTGGVYVFHQ